ncbi:Transposase IS116/IS110/IS902 family protein [Paracoccus alcaliphilus]|uniref:Transposase IS116/IS110/IS902 family protein n=1 Tax=Paracoccus alcaliphilus TaxID=34002 RepID=A0A1H8I9Q3_9RHOB|nr:Transposase IS116/IS110/IS902 family protein [Paracoccus alcaliphilus]
MASRRWLTTERFTHPAQQIVLQGYIDAVADAEARIERLTGQIAGLLPQWSLAPVVAAVQAMRGVGFKVAVTVVAEVGGFHRFDSPRQLMAYLVLTPSEHSSGASVRRGGITKAGSGLARRALIEGAWSYRMQPRVSVKLLARLEALPQMVRDIAWKGQLRMCQRYRHLVAAGKAKVVVATAIAREMLGFVWAIARAVTTPTAAPVAKAL